MNKIPDKYRKPSALLILSAYILLALFNIFHFHPTKIAFEPILAHGQDSPGNKFSSAYYDVNFSCPFHSAFSSIHSGFDSVKIFSCSLKKENTVTEPEISSLHLNDISKLNPLRAPPKNISI